MSIQRSYCEIAEHCAKLGASRDLAEAGKIWLGSKPEADFLLIIDGIHDPLISSNLPEILPAGRGAVLITTLNPQVTEHASHGMFRRLEDMDIEDSITLLLDTAQLDVSHGDSREQVRPLVKSLQQLPLAVKLAGAAIRQLKRFCTGNVAIERYTEGYAVTRKRLPSHSGLDQKAEDSDDSVFAAWEVSFEAIVAQNARLRTDIEETLAVSAHFHHERIPFELLAHAPSHSWFGVVNKAIRSIRSRFMSSVTATIKKQSQLEDALSALDNYSLITLNGETGEISMHRLVHTWVCHKFSSDTRCWSYEAARITLDRCVQIGDAEEHHRKRRRFYPHIQSFTDDTQGPLEIKNLESLHSIIKFAQVAFEAGNFELCRKLYEMSLGFAQRNVGPRSTTSLEIIERIGAVLERQGFYKEAIKNALLAVQSRNNILGSEDPKTLQALANLGLALQGRGKYSRARAVNQKVLDRIATKGMTKQDINLVLEVKNNQASVLQMLGEYGEAELLSREVLELRETTPGLGMDHPETMDTVDTLALILEKQDKWEESRVFSQRAYSQRKDILGELHPDTLMSLSRLGSVLSRQGELTAAQDLQAQVLNSRKKVLGLSHPDTVTSFNHLAAILLALGDHEGAEKAFREAESGYTEAFREGDKYIQRDHPFLSIVRSNLAVCLRKQGRNAEAERIYRDILNGYDDLSHPGALICRENLAVLLRQENKLTEAEQEGREVLLAYERRDGPSSVSASRALYSLACTIARYKDKDEEAEIMTRKALEGLEVSLGKKHHEVFTAMAQLGHVLRCRKEFQESWREFERACLGFESIGVTKHWCFNHFSALREIMEKKGIQGPLPAAQSGEIEHTEKGKRSLTSTSEVEHKSESLRKRPYESTDWNETGTELKRPKKE